MANRDYKNVKRFVDGISKEVQETMEGGGTAGRILTATCTWGGEWRYSSSFSFATTDSSISTFDDLFNWLEENGYTYEKQGQDNRFFTWVDDNGVFVDEEHASDDTRANLEAISAYTSPKGNRRGIFIDNYPSTVSPDNIIWKDEMPADFAISILGNE